MALTLRDDQYLPDQGVYASSWRTDASIAGGGTLIEHSIHDLDVFRWFAGDPSSVACRTTSFFGHERIEDAAVATLAYPTGCMATLVSVWHQVLSRTSTRRVEAFCENAFLWTENDQRGPLHIETSHGADAVDCVPAHWVADLPVPDVVRGPLSPYVEATRAFLDAVAKGEATTPNAADALAAHRVVDAAYRSAASDGLPVVL
jgi:predicted dehydrogenase